MYYKENVRDSNEEFNFGCFGKETEFETVDIKTDNWPAKHKARVCYSEGDILVLCKPYLCLSIAISDIAEEENYSGILYT